MKISCLPCSLFGAIQNGEMSVRQWAEEAARIGFDGFDISLLMLTGHVQSLRALRHGSICARV